MTATIYQPQDGPRYNDGERQVLSFLRRLPAGYTVIREPAIARAHQRDLPARSDPRARRTPDFIVVGPDIGAMVIEVKDWNFADYMYRWVDQKTVVRTPGSKELENPFEKADEYYFWVAGVLRRESLDGRLPVSSVLAFPRTTRATFLNHLDVPRGLADPQVQMLIDAKTVLFSEDLTSADPLPQLKGLARLFPGSRPASQNSAEKFVDALLPALRVGGGSVRRTGERVELARLSDAQRAWALSISPDERLLLDVAGSGKTTVLLARAMHLVDRGDARRVLVTAYSEELARDLRRKLDAKTTPGTGESYHEAITVRSVPAITSELALAVPGAPSDEDERMKAVARALHDGPLASVERFDAVFVDEVQDLSNPMFLVLEGLCPSGNFFFAGDGGQRLFERTGDLYSVGLQPAAVRMAATYRMYRTPRHVATLAHRFVWDDPETRIALEAQGYRSDADPVNPVTTVAEIVEARDAADALSRINDRISSLVRDGAAEEDIMVIVSERRVEAVTRALQSLGRRLARGDRGGLLVVHFDQSKGLERPHVLVSGIEDLHDPRAAPLTETAVARRLSAGFATRRVYVALTRSTETAWVVVWDLAHPLVQRLMVRHREVLSEVQRTR